MHPAIRAFFLLFFGAHIVGTVLIDSQAVLPRAWHPAFAVDALAGYVARFGDPLMAARPPWFRSLVWASLLVQLPFFGAAAYAFAARRNWIRAPALLYSGFACAAMVPILAELAAHRARGYEPGPLLAMYGPYLAAPAALGAYMAAHERPFGAAGGGGVGGAAPRRPKAA